ncbi:hypothetical protein [Curtobacterium sp. MCBD17_030]|uniref:hypothetical protein n=1 Tax=Curtobacterium sp. MCBD17_030 TaxID=2175649 RepID=UPI000D9BEA05|nr:hypothetical protein [Curtobacterium sp. MCBD17_030]PYY35874.1 hypothetical protein DEI89_06330 [Curtobacterium sp. MCBD17_030]
MDLQQTDVISGLPAPVAVKFLRYFRGPGAMAPLGTPLLDPEHGTDRDALVRLEADGYVEHIADHQWGPSYRTTTSGNAVANHRWTKPITRKTADRLLDEAVTRAKAFNADDTRATIIARIRVFGSYLNREKDRLGDLDLGLDVRLRRTYDGAEAFSYAQRAGVLYADSLVDHEAWLRAEAAKAVRGRSRSISPTTENPADLDGPWRDEYEFDGLHLLPEIAQQGTADLGW